MAFKLKNIGQNQPNETLVQLLEGLLEEAKAGEIVSMVAAIGHSGLATSQAMAIDEKSSQQMLKGELSDCIITLSVPVIAQFFEQE